MAGWSLPQHDLPGKGVLSEDHIYARRERVFLVLASVFVAASAMLPLLGFTRLFGATSLVGRVGLEAPSPLVVPVGALAFPLALLSLNMVNALYGKHRARSLLLAGTIIWVGVLGLHWATDHVVAYDRTTTAAYLPGVALAACALVTCVVQIEAFALMRRVIALRAIIPALLGISAGWGIAAVIIDNVPVPIGEPVLGVALAAGGYTWLGVVAGTLVLAIIMRPLATYLRFALREPARDDFDFDDGSSEPEFVVRKRGRVEIVDD